MRGKIYQTINDEKVWRVQHSAETKDLTGVFFSNTANAWTVNDENLILHYVESRAKVISYQFS